MSATRVPFDASLPFVVTASGGLPCSGKRYEYGELFPWRELGLSESDLAALWIANQVDALPDTVAFLATPGPRVYVETPSQQRKRRARS